jgi:hypothetical protein
MIDRVYDFFFGDQLRKHIVLISAFFLGQLFAIPLFGSLEPSQYVVFAVSVSLLSIWPLVLLYDRFHIVRREHREAPIEVKSGIKDQELRNTLIYQKMISELSLNLARVMMRNCEALRVAEVPNEEILRMIQIMQSNLRREEEIFSEKVHGLIAEYKAKNRVC